MFSVKFTIGLLLVLGIPFLIRYKYKEKYEPFPAILLPSGASKAPVLSNEYHVTYTDLTAQHTDGSWDKVDARLLLYPLPYTSHKHVFENAFGLMDEPRPTERHPGLLRRLKNMLKTRTPTEQEKRETKNWLRQRLREQWFTGKVLNIVKRERMISIASGKIIREKIIDEKNLSLD